MFKVTVHPTDEPNIYEVYVANIKCGSRIHSLDPLEKIQTEHQMPGVCFRYGMGIYYEQPVPDIDIEIFTIVTDLVEGFGNVL